jgi:hypothetical protein
VGYQDGVEVAIILKTREAALAVLKFGEGENAYLESYQSLPDTF